MKSSIEAARKQFLSLGGRLRKVKEPKSKKSTKKFVEKTQETVEPVEEYLDEYLPKSTDEVTKDERIDRKLLHERFMPSKVRQESFICDVCGLHIESQILLKVHRAKHDKGAELPNLAIVNPAKTLTNSSAVSCDICGRDFAKLSDLRQHLKIHMERDECEVCHKKFRLLSKHIQEVHTNDRPFECKSCKTAFKTKGNLKNHLKVHDEPSDCPVCHKMFPNLERHLKYHKRAKPDSFECSICKKILSTKCALQEHVQRVHEKMPLGKIYTCQQCNLNFIRNRDLRRHSYIHYAGNIFHCKFPDCNEMFKIASRLKSHMMIHEINEPSFACNYCDKIYLRKTALHKHQQQIHSEISKKFTIENVTDFNWLKS